MTRVVVDTGPLVALLNRQDTFHEWARDVFATIAPPVFTCEAVVSEACFLLARIPAGQDAMLTLLLNDVVKVDFRLSAEIGALQGHMQKFASIPMSLADACLVRMTELEPDSVVLTLDSDFQLYRRNRRQVIPIVTPLGGASSGRRGRKWRRP